jgi:hypothetical protein
MLLLLLLLLLRARAGCPSMHAQDADLHGHVRKSNILPTVVELQSVHARGFELQSSANQTPPISAPSGPRKAVLGRVGACGRPSEPSRSWEHVFFLPAPSFSRGGGRLALGDVSEKSSAHVLYQVLSGFTLETTSRRGGAPTRSALW